MWRHTQQNHMAKAVTLQIRKRKFTVVACQHRARLPYCVRLGEYGVKKHSLPWGSFLWVPAKGSEDPKEGPSKSFVLSTVFTNVQNGIH